MNGGEIIAKILSLHQVDFLFTLCGGHISPIFVAAKQIGIRVIDTRNEASAVFAADAVARLSGKVGVAAVTAGPGVTNSVTAIKNAQMAQSPLILLGGAAATVLKGRGSLQDIDQISLMRPITKWAVAVKRVKDFVPTLFKAFRVAQEGVPGPVFVECPIDLLYGETMVKEWYLSDKKKQKSLGDKLIQWYLKRHVHKIFDGVQSLHIPNERPVPPAPPHHQPAQLQSVALALRKAQRPLLLIGSGAMLHPSAAHSLAQAVSQLQIPVFLSGTARGLLGKNHPLQRRHNRRDALKQADLVLLAGVPCDFRLDYGRHLSSKATYIGVNLSRKDLYMNKKPTVAVQAEPAAFLIALAQQCADNQCTEWLHSLQQADDNKEKNIDQQAAEPTNGINPIALFRALDPFIEPHSVLVADGGDFVATSAYTLRPPKPLSWLDPGVFGTLGVGGGFALGAKLCNPNDDVWVIYGDGSSAYSITEIDTMIRHRIPAIFIIGNDAAWSQIARDQTVILGDDVATVLAYSDYERIATAFGALGRRVSTISDFVAAVQEAKTAVRQGIPFVINAIIGKSDFRKGSISV